METRLDRLCIDAQSGRDPLREWRRSDGLWSESGAAVSVVQSAEQGLGHDDAALGGFDIAGER